MNKKRIALVIISIACIFTVFAQSGLATRYVNAATEQYDAKKYAEAYKYINTALAGYDANSIPENVEIIAQLIYTDYITEVKNNNDVKTFREIQTNYNAFSFISNDNLKRLIETTDAQFAELARQEELQVAKENADKTAKEVANATKEALAANADALIAANEQSNQQLQQQFEQQSQQQKEFFQQQNQLNKEDNEKRDQQLQEYLEKQNQQSQDSINKLVENSNTNNSKLILLIFAIIGFLVLVVVIVIVITIRLSHKQQEMFTQTLRAVSEMQRIPLEAADSLRLADVYSGMRAIEDANASSREPTNLKEFEEEEVDELLRSELRELATACEKEGIKIDKATSRKNNSKNVAELVFKIAQAHGLGEYKSMLYFCAAMVYDIGFLRIDPSLLAADSLSEDQKYKIRSHVRAGSAMLDFVPDKFRPVFLEATLMHHENLDGTGYPDGLRADQIPAIARIIRVVESFIAQISKRNYKGIFDKETAISELRNKPNWYDQEIVETLDKLI